MSDLSKSPVIVPEQHFVNSRENYPDLNGKAAQIKRNPEYFIRGVLRFRFVFLEYIHGNEKGNEGSNDADKCQTCKYHIADMRIHVQQRNGCNHQHASDNK